MVIAMRGGLSKPRTGSHDCISSAVVLYGSPLSFLTFSLLHAKVEAV